MKMSKKFLTLALASSMVLSAGSVSIFANTINSTRSASITLNDVKEVFPELKKVSKIPDGVTPMVIKTVDDLDKAVELVESYSNNNSRGATGKYQSSGGYNLGNNEYETYLRYKINSFATLELSTIIQYYTSNPNKPKATLDRQFSMTGLTPGLGFTGNTPSVTTTSSGNVQVKATGNIKTYALIEKDWFELSSESVTMAYTIYNHMFVDDYYCRIR